MDELEIYLKNKEYYDARELERILNTKIIITKKHVQCIANGWGYPYYNNIINLFEKYGYVFTDNDYISLICQNGNMLQYISNDRITNEMCKIAVKQNKTTLRYVPNDKKHLFI